MLNRSIAPAFTNLQGLELTKPEIQPLNSKWPACIFHDGRYPVIVTEMIFSNGRWWENTIGASHFAAKMLMEGTSRLNSTDISKTFARYGSYLEILPGVDFVNVRLHALKKYFRPSMELLLHLLQDASFPEEEFNTLKGIRQANIRNQLARNNQLANAKFAEALFGEKHPYGRILTPEMVEASTIDQVREEYKSRFFNSPKIILSGDVEEEVPWLSDQLQVLPTFEYESDSNFQLPNAKSESINKGGNQASIRFGAFTINRKHKDIFKLTVANRLLGGFFGSRLMKNIREEKGLTYGIYSHIVHFAHASYWVIGSEVNKEDVSVAEQEVKNEILELASNPPSEEEMTLLKNYSTGKMMADIDSPLSLSSLYKPQFLMGIPFDYYDRYLESLNSITPAEVSDAITQHLDLEALTTVVVS